MSPLRDLPQRVLDEGELRRLALGDDEALRPLGDAPQLSGQLT